MAQTPRSGDDAGTTDVPRTTDLDDVEDLRDVDHLELPDGAVLEILDVRHQPRGTEPDWTVKAEKPSGHPVEWHEWHVENLLAAGARPVDDAPAEPLPDPADLDRTQLHQRVALEAVAGDDPARGLALRLRDFFGDGAAVHPRQRDTVSVRGKGPRVVEATIGPTGFEADEIQHDGVTTLVRGVEFTRFGGAFE